MIIAKVIGNVWATRKEESLSGLKLMVLRRMDPAGNQDQDSFVAADCVGAGIGERVLVVTGSSARVAMRTPDIPVDAAIIGIIDEVETREEA